jgi:hypothetical protein
MASSFRCTYFTCEGLIELTTESHPQLTPFAQELFTGLYRELCTLDDRISENG